MMGRNYFGCLLVIGLLFATNPSAQAQSKTFRLMLSGLLSFDVDTISSPQANRLLNSSNKTVFLDAREKEEFQVSHIKGARNVGYDHFTLEGLNIPRTTPVIVYCSVGYRSEKVSEKLIAAGFTDVKNLYGGIFDWVNNGYSVYDAGGRVTKKVHAFSPEWGIWLEEGDKVY